MFRRKNKNVQPVNPRHAEIIAAAGVAGTIVTSDIQGMYGKRCSSGEPTFVLLSCIGSLGFSTPLESGENSKLLPDGRMVDSLDLANQYAGSCAYRNPGEDYIRLAPFTDNSGDIWFMVTGGATPYACGDGEWRERHCSDYRISKRREYWVLFRHSFTTGAACSARPCREY